MRLNIDRPAALGWAWAIDPGFRGYVGREDFIGRREAGWSCDRVYPEYILELARKLNILIELLRGTAPTRDVAADCALSTAMLLEAVRGLAADLQLVPDTIMSHIDVDGHTGIAVQAQSSVLHRSAAHGQLALRQPAQAASDILIPVLVQAAGRVRAAANVDPQNINIGQKVLVSAESKRYVRTESGITAASAFTETDMLMRMVALAYPDPASLSSTVSPVETGQGQALRTEAKQSVFSRTTASAEKRSRQLMVAEGKTRTISSTETGALPSQGVSAEKSTGITVGCTLDTAWLPPVWVDGGLWIRQVHDDPIQKADGTLEVS